MMVAESIDQEKHNRRQQERFSIQLPVRVSINQGTDIEFQYETVCANISSGGVFLKTNKPLPVASRVHLEFFAPLLVLKKLRFVLSLNLLRQLKGKPVWFKTTGIVIRHQEKNMAVIFDHNYQFFPLQGSSE
ncbi:MAG: hypothetical protein CR981_03740 [Proteobacteria bacterium]|nr:MAG: hypothetical protein CR981_03740 [Pseudomonadota bacterium]